MSTAQSGRVGPDFSEFLNPHSMMTPGALGALAMVGTNAICSQFSLGPKYVVLVLSLLFGLAAIIEKAELPTRLLFYILNSIIIFSVAAGTNTVGRAATTGIALQLVPSAYATEEQQLIAQSFFKPWFSSPQSVPDADQNVWYVIVGSYPTKDAAEKAAQSINDRFPGKYAARAAKSLQSDWWFVRVGDDATLAEATSMKTKADADKVSSESFLQHRILRQPF
jgi:hypothetical protein